MIKLKKIKYNLILGVLIGFFLAQLVIAEGYAIIVGKSQNNIEILKKIPLDINDFKIIAILVFILTILIFCTKKFRKINFNKISIYLLLVFIISCIAAIEGVFILIATTFKLYPNIEKYIGIDYFMSINMFYFICFIGLTIFLVTFLLLVNRKVNYIKFLTKEVKVIKNKGFGKTIKVKGEDELADLCKSINNMSLELGEKINKEKEIEKNKNELITNISHDLKTPLTSIIGYLEILNTKQIDEITKEEYSKIAYNKSLRLKELINDLFEYTKLTSYDIKLQKSNFNISNLINQIVGESIIGFLEKEIKIELENPYKELFYPIDIKLFTRVLENLIKNAEKYSDSNSIFYIKVQDSNSKIIISFINKCEAITSKDLNKIFERFYRLDESRSNSNEGSGLGLTIAKRIVNLHNGELITEKQNEYLELKIILNKA